MTTATMLVSDGVKILNDRTFNASSSYSIPNRFKVSIDTPDVTWSDSSLTTVIPISGTETVDACNVTTGWTASGSNSVTVNTSTFKPDGATDGALNIVKSDTSSATFSVSKSTTSLNGTSKDFLIWFYIKDSTALAKFKSSGTAFEIRFGSDSSNYYTKTYTASTLVTGWTFIKLAIPTDFSTTGSPTITALDYTYIATITNNTTDTFVAGDVIFDAIRLATVDDYYKTVDSITINNNDASVAIVSKLTVSEANGFLINGNAVFNTDSSELMLSKAKFPNNSKDTTDLFKITTKLKFRNINQ